MNELPPADTKPTKKHTKHWVSDFIERHYGIGLKEISSKLRAPLLDNVENVACNLCGGTEFYPVGEHDKFRLPVKSAMCRTCGLICLNPRPTAAAYGKHYEGGGAEDSTYHRKIDFEKVEGLLKTYYGPEFTMDEAARAAMSQYVSDHGFNKEDSSKSTTNEDPKHKHRPRKLSIYGTQIYEELKSLVPVNGKVFETGASRGKQLEPWKVLHGCEATGIEPKKEAVLAAKRMRGLDLLQGFSDNPQIPESYFDLVINTNTINHMLDPLGDLRHAWRWLKPGSVLFVDVSDIVRECRYFPFEDSLVEIDHCFMFSLKTLTAMVQKAGFTIERSWVTDLTQVMPWQPEAFKSMHARIIARKSTSPVEIDWPTPAEELNAVLRGQLEYNRELEAELEERNRNQDRKFDARLQALGKRNQTLKDRCEELEERSRTMEERSRTMEERYRAMEERYRTVRDRYRASKAKLAEPPPPAAGRYQAMVAGLWKRLRAPRHSASS